MKKILSLTAVFLLTLSFMGCASLTRPTAQADNNAGVAALPPYSGPKARIAIADFDVKATKASGEIGSGLREMLVTALVNSNRFSIIERQALSAAASGSAPQRGKTKTADLIVSATVTEFESQASGGKAGIGGGGGAGSGILGGLLGTALNKAHMALDIRIVDASTSAVLASTRVQGQASDVAGGFMTGFMGNWALGGGLSAYANTPMEKAIRVCIIEAVRYIAQTVPPNCYKY